MVCFLPLSLVYQCEPFSILFQTKKEKENVLWYICANAKFPPKSILGLILIRLERCKKS
jgi:hypothetical protein